MSKKLDPPMLEKVISARKSGQSMRAIAADVGVSPPTVRRWLIEAGISTRRKVKGWTTDRSGYKLVIVHPDWEFYDAMALNRGKNQYSKYVMEHRKVMAENLGRALESYETVHHINGVRNDNRPENLQLRSGKHGNGIAHQCADCGSSNINSIDI